MADPKKKAYKEALAEFRKRHFKELEISLTRLIEIRDDDEAEDKDRIKACQEIGRFLAAREIDKTPTKKSDLPPEKKAKLTEKELQEIEDTISA
jgi:hypothetical protein